MAEISISKENKYFWVEHNIIATFNTIPCTGCKSVFQKIFEFKIWKEPMSVLK